MCAACADEVKEGNEGLRGLMPAGVPALLTPRTALKGKPAAEEREDTDVWRGMPGVEPGRCRVESECEEAVRAAEALDSMIEKQ
jgi:hypothetical protein